MITVFLAAPFQHRCIDVWSVRSARIGRQLSGREPGENSEGEWSATRKRISPSTTSTRHLPSSPLQGRGATFSPSRRAQPTSPTDQALTSCVWASASRMGWVTSYSHSNHHWAPAGVSTSLCPRSTILRTRSPQSAQAAQTAKNTNELLTVVDYEYIVLVSHHPEDACLA